MIKEEFKIRPQKNGKYTMESNVIETDISPGKVLYTYNQIDRDIGKARYALQEQEPHIIEARKKSAEEVIKFMDMRAKEIQNATDISDEVKMELLKELKKQRDQKTFEISLYDKDNIELRKEQIKKQIETKELRLKEIQPFINKIKLQMRKEEEKMKRLSKEAREKKEKEMKEQKTVTEK